VLDETVGVVPFEAGTAAGLTPATACVADVLTTTGATLVTIEAAGVLAVDWATAALADVEIPPFAIDEAIWVLDSDVVVVVGAEAAAAVVSASVSVVEALGTAVHRCPSIEVMKNPAGRLVDMANVKSDTSRCKERRYKSTFKGYQE